MSFLYYEKSIIALLVVSCQETGDVNRHEALGLHVFCLLIIHFSLVCSDMSSVPSFLTWIVPVVVIRRKHPIPPFDVGDVHEGGCLALIQLLSI